MYKPKKQAEPEVWLQYRSLEEEVYQILAETDEAIIEVDQIMTDFSQSMLNFRGYPQQLAFELKLESQIVKSQMDRGFENQSYENQIFKKNLADLDQNRYAEKDMLDAMDKKVNFIKSHIGKRRVKTPVPLPTPEPVKLQFQETDTEHPEVIADQKHPMQELPKAEISDSMASKSKKPAAKPPAKKVK